MLNTQTSLRLIVYLSIAFSIGLMSHGSYAGTPKQVDVSMANKKLNLELADTYELRALGLMYRKSLCADCGMVFSYPKPRYVNFWMKNTYIALDLAFVDKEGVITKIVSLEPHDLKGAGSNSKVVYVVEMNKGWFAKHDVGVGDKILIASH